MKRLADLVANFLGALVLALLIFDPAGDLTIVFVLMSFAVALWLVGPACHGENGHPAFSCGCRPPHLLRSASDGEDGSRADFRVSFQDPGVGDAGGMGPM